MKAGPQEVTPEGWVPVSPSTLRDWSSLTGYPLSPWRAETILKASKAFVNTYYSKDKSPPWKAAEDKKSLSAQIKSAFRAIKQV